MTTTAKPRAKFSSRNLSAVFKAPLRSKPLPDNAVQRPTNSSRMLVLGRAAVAAPAPINTPSLKREIQVHDVHVSLVPAGSNWAENADMQQKPQETETVAAPAQVEPHTAAPEKVWTPESVVEHLHTSTVAAPPKVTTSNFGRWGDDAVEHDIFQNNVRRQMQKEREFPDLKEAVEESQTHHGQGHASAADRSPSMGPQQTEQHRGRATGRWAHFGEQEEMHRVPQDDRWSRDRYGRDEGDRGSRDRYSRDEDDRGSRDRYSRYEDDRWSRGRSSRCDDGYGRDRRPQESDNSVMLPVPNDNHTHFSRSDARFDGVASGDRDRVLSHSPHRMDWNSGRLGRREERSSSPAPQHGPEGSRFHAPQPNRSLTQSRASVSPSAAPTTSPQAADAAPARAMNWRSLTSPDRAPDRVTGTQHHPANAWAKTDEPAIPVAEVAERSTDSSSISSENSSPIPPQQLQLLKRPKMLFDPKTGSMVSAADKVSSSASKRQAGGRTGAKDREAVNATAVPEVKSQSSTNSNNARKPETESTATAAKVTKSERSAREEEAPVAVIAVNAMQEIRSETSSDAVIAKQAVGNADGVTSKKGFTRATAKQSARQQSASCATKSSRDHQPKQGKRQNPPIAAVEARAEPFKRSSPTTRADRRSTGGKKPSSTRKVQLASAQKVDTTEEALVKRLAEGANGNVVLVTGEQEGVEVSLEDDGFETVKSRRVVLSEKKQLRQCLASGEAAARASEFVEEKKKNVSVSSCANEQSKGDEVQETFGVPSKPRAKVGKDKKQKSASKQPKHKTKDYKPKMAAVQPVAQPTEQVAGEAPAESPLSKKKSQTTAKREPKSRKQSSGTSTSKPNDRKAVASGAARKQTPSKRQDGEQAGDIATARTVEKVPAAKAAKARPKQVRKVYVVKTPAPSATSTAA